MCMCMCVRHSNIEHINFQSKRFVSANRISQKVLPKAAKMLQCVFVLLRLINDGGAPMCGNIIL